MRRTTEKLHSASPLGTMGTPGNFCIFIFIAISIHIVSSASINEDLLQRLSNIPRVRVKRITGNGTEIGKGDWPWLVKLKGKVPRKSFWGMPYDYVTYSCGGSILNKRWILTAAHCFTHIDKAKDTKYWHVKVGEVIAHDHWYDRVLSFFGNDKVWSHHGEQLRIHPDYSAKDKWKNDLALLKVGKDMPIENNGNVRAVTLPDGTEGSNWPPIGAQCVMKGWGCDHAGGSLSDNAKAVTMPKLLDRVCRDTYDTTMLTRLCAGYQGTGGGICQGDSGGPLVCPYGDSYRQAGIASFTSAKNPDKHPGTFTRVTAYVQWIQDNIKET